MELDRMYQDTMSRIKELDRSLKCIISRNPTDPSFYAKEQEIQRLKKEVEFMEQERATRFAPQTYSRYPPNLSSFLTEPTPQPDYSKQFFMVYSIPFTSTSTRRKPKKESSSHLSPDPSSTDRKQKSKVPDPPLSSSFMVAPIINTSLKSDGNTDHLLKPFILLQEEFEIL